MTKHRPTEAQEAALRLAYSDDHLLYDEADEFDGVSPATLRSLHRHRWVVADPTDRSGDSLVLTSRGRRALGLEGSLLRKPKRMKTALLRAIEHFLTDRADVRSPGAMFEPEDLPGAVWVNDDQQADFSEALWLVDTGECDLIGFDDVDWACVARLVSELGFPCYTSSTRYIQAFWPEDED